jgi:hypothetical protein
METCSERAVKKELDGVLIDYEYSSGQGRHHVVSLGPERLDFASPWPGEKAMGPPPPFRPPEGGVEYRARKIQDGLYLIQWIVPNTSHIVLLFDFRNKKTVGAGLMPGQTELWDVGNWSRWQLPPALKQYQGKGHQ